MFELNWFLSLQILPFLPFLFRSNLFFSCMSRDVNHAFCVVYKILGAVALFYRIYSLPGLIQPFSTAVCWQCGQLSLRVLYLKTRDGLKCSIPLFQTSRYVNRVIHLVITQPCVRLSCFTGCFPPGLITFFTRVYVVDYCFGFQASFSHDPITFVEGLLALSLPSFFNALLLRKPVIGEIYGIIWFFCMVSIRILKF